MKILLDQIIVDEVIYSNVKKFLSKPRIEYKMVDTEIFKPLDDVDILMFTYQVFNNRVNVADNYLIQNGIKPYGDLIQVIPNIVSYTNPMSSDNDMTLNLIVTDDTDVLFLAIEDEDKVNDVSEGYWMGLYYVGSDVNFSNILDELSIDFHNCLRGHLLKPKPAPEGYDHNLSIVQNTQKVCCTEESTPSELSELIAVLLEPDSPVQRRYVLTTEERNVITYEDIWFPIDDTQYNMIIYRDRSNERKTYVIVYDNISGDILQAMTAQTDADGEYALTVDHNVIHNTYLSVVDELR